MSIRSGNIALALTGLLLAVGAVYADEGDRELTLPLSVKGGWNFVFLPLAPTQSSKSAVR